MSAGFYFRLADDGEKQVVASTGELWGKAKAPIAGNHLPSVKAYVGKLPQGSRGYTFTTDVAPTHFRRTFGRRSAEWVDGSAGVEDVPGHGDFVKIKVRVDP